MSTERFKGKLNLVKFIICRLKLIFTTAAAASKNDACFKCGQNRPENSHLTLLIKIRDTLSIMKMFVLKNRGRSWPTAKVYLGRLFFHMRARRRIKTFGRQKQSGSRSDAILRSSLSFSIDRLTVIHRHTSIDRA